MPLPPADAIADRDELLVRTRRVHQAIVVSAITAAVGLSTVFAHALPGQHSAAQNAAAGPAQAGGTSQPGQRTATHPGARHHHYHHHHQLRPPSQPPTPVPATSPASPPPVTSGGS
ncbi:MAG: hypothetical protein ABJB47_06360 [Actinomycetota bacterium]